MPRSRKSATAAITIPPAPWTYPQLAGHLRVSVRTLKRYVVGGSIPQPTIVRNRGQWSGASLVAAQGGPQIPGTYDYAPNSRELKRVATIEHRELQAARGARLRAAKAAKAGRAEGGVA